MVKNTPEKLLNRPIVGLYSNPIVIEYFDKNNTDVLEFGDFQFILCRKKPFDFEYIQRWVEFLVIEENKKDISDKTTILENVIMNKMTGVLNDKRIKKDKRKGKGEFKTGHEIYKNKAFLGESLKKLCDIGILKKVGRGCYKLKKAHFQDSKKTYEISLLNSIPSSKITFFENSNITFYNIDNQEYDEKTKKEMHRIYNEYNKLQKRLYGLRQKMVVKKIRELPNKDYKQNIRVKMLFEIASTFITDYGVGDIGEMVLIDKSEFIKDVPVNERAWYKRMVKRNKKECMSKIYESEKNDLSEIGELEANIILQVIKGKMTEKEALREFAGQTYLSLPKNLMTSKQEKERSKWIEENAQLFKVRLEFFTKERGKDFFEPLFKFTNILYPYLLTDREKNLLFWYLEHRCHIKEHKEHKKIFKMREEARSLVKELNQNIIVVCRG